MAKEVSRSERLACQRDLFTLPPDDEEGAPLYFDGAGRTPLMKSAHAAGVTAIAHKLRPWLMPSGDDTVGEVRRLFARLIGAHRDNIDKTQKKTAGDDDDVHHALRSTGAEHVALTPSTSYAMSLAARNVRMEPGQRAVVLWDQMASNVMPWQEVGEFRCCFFFLPSPFFLFFCSALLPPKEFWYE